LASSFLLLSFSGVGTMGSFEVKETCGRARTGTFLSRFDTPNLLMYARRGFPSPLTLRDLDNLGDSNTGLVQVAAPDFLDTPASVIASCEDGLKEFCGLKGRKEAMILTLRDAFSTQCGMPASDGWVTVSCFGGQKKMELDKYFAMVQAMRPEVAECLPDEVASDAALKRVRKSVDRSIEFTDACIKARSDGKLPQSTRLFGVVAGGLDERERARSAQEVAKRAVDGFSVCGLGTGETARERWAVLEAVVGVLPQGKPRALHGPGTPEEVLAAVALGVDLLESSYPSLLTSQSTAIVYPVSYAHVMEEEGAGARQEAREAVVCGKLNLRDSTLCRDAGPILAGCQCFACGKHTRAYIHHLINTREILGDVLLHIHNQHHYAQFFGAIRESIRTGTFEAYSARFLEKRKHMR